MISVLDAKRLLKTGSAPLQEKLKAGAEFVSLPQSLGRVSTKSLLSPVSVPLFDNSAMDGFTLRSSDTKTASRISPSILKITGTICAGDEPGILKEERATFRIMTGAPIPEGADTVVMKENVEESDGKITIFEKQERGSHIRFKGEEIQADQLALKAGSLITPGVIGYLSSLGIQNVPVMKLPRVSLLATGSELVEASSLNSPAEIKPGKIFESNSSLLTASLKEMGLTYEKTVTVRDNPKLLKKEIDSLLLKSDIVILTGGVSVGDYDYTRDILHDMGVETLFWKVNQKPGKPLYVGRLATGQFGEKIIFGLPGNPFSVFVCFYIYVRPTLLTLMGHSDTELKKCEMKISSDYLKKDQKTHFLKGKTISKEGELFVEILEGQGSHLQRSLTEANVLVKIPSESTGVLKGEFVSVLFLP